MARPYEICMGRIGFGSVTKRALKESGEFVRWPKGSAVMTSAVGAIGGAVATWLTTGVWLLSALGAFVGVAALFLGVFLVKLATVPYAIANEKETERSALEEQLKERTDRREVTESLISFIEEAKGYQQRLVKVLDPPQSAEVKGWVKGVHHYIRDNVGATQAYKFINDSGFDLVTNPFGTGSKRELGKIYALLERRISRLGEIIDKLD